jgi:hypothetical protein
MYHSVHFSSLRVQVAQLINPFVESYQRIGSNTLLRCTHAVTNPFHFHHNCLSVLYDKLCYQSFNQWSVWYSNDFNNEYGANDKTSNLGVFELLQLYSTSGLFL